VHDVVRMLVLDASTIQLVGQSQNDWIGMWLLDKTD